MVTNDLHIPFGRLKLTQHRSVVEVMEEHAADEQLYPLSGAEMPEDRAEHIQWGVQAGSEPPAHIAKYVTHGTPIVLPPHLAKHAAHGSAPSDPVRSSASCCSRLHDLGRAG